MDGAARARRWAAWTLLFTVSLAPLHGCTLIQGALIVMKGQDVSAEYNGLKDKTVAVVCRPKDTLQYSSAGAAREISRRVSQLIGENVRKVTMVDQRKIAEWTDENSWEEYAELGKALDADYVVGIDLHQFSLREGTTLMQGKADIHVEVYEVATGDSPWKKDLPSTRFPTTPISSMEKTEPAFRKQFVEVLSQQIARHFYTHDAYIDFANDSTVLE
ncbi:MAG: hypothetical protein U0836_12830 [Pirellulales bacterium]